MSLSGIGVSIARCPEHGLHGERSECFVCGGPVEQVAMIPVDGPAIVVCLADIVRKLAELNRRHLATGGRAALQLEDFTWRERALDLHHRVGLVWLQADNGERPSMHVLLSALASGLAFALALDQAELADIASGSEAA